tara:strand:+ start:71 stop:613 length:543 start_codon:yes stop_codon:yes gene_type:complete
MNCQIVKNLYQTAECCDNKTNSVNVCAPGTKKIGDDMPIMVVAHWAKNNSVTEAHRHEVSDSIHSEDMNSLLLMNSISIPEGCAGLCNDRLNVQLFANLADYKSYYGTLGTSVNYMTNLFGVQTLSKMTLTVPHSQIEEAKGFTTPITQGVHLLQTALGHTQATFQYKTHEPDSHFKTSC